MKTYVCRCGDYKSIRSSSPDPCRACPKCGTRPASTPEGWVPPEPHRWETEMVDTDEGAKPLTICLWCGKKKEAGDV